MVGILACASPTLAQTTPDAGTPSETASATSPAIPLVRKAAAPITSAPPKTSTPPLFDFESDDTPDYFTRRFEPAGFPLIGGTSDIGFEFGGVLTLTKFGDGTRPYAWNMDLVLSASVKDLPAGLGIAQQNYLWQLHMPGLAGGRLRLNPEVGYQRTINAGYFGLGNASSGVRPAGSAGTYYQYVHQEAGIRHITRYALVGHVDLMFSSTLRYVNPTAYVGSQLATDAAAHAASGGPLLTGVEALGIAGQAAGFVYDSRDSEIFTKSGAFHQLGVKLSQSLNDGHVRYGEAGLILANYTPVGGPFVLATRAIADLDFGNVPFYELFNGEVFVPDQIPGGSAGIRGVPEGRYLGPIKLVGNVEMRAMWRRASLPRRELPRRQRRVLRHGPCLVRLHVPLAARRQRARVQVGSGRRDVSLVGQAAIFRMEIAYSPDAEAENPGFPFGVYVEDGVMF